MADGVFGPTSGKVRGPSSAPGQAGCCAEEERGRDKHFMLSIRGGFTNVLEEVEKRTGGYGSERDDHDGG